MVALGVRISFTGRDVRVCLGLQGLRAGVEHRSAECQEGDDHECKISDITTGHSVLPVCGLSSSNSSSPDYSRRRWVWREPVSGRRVWVSTPIRALGAPTHLDGRYACPAQPVTDW